MRCQDEDRVLQLVALALDQVQGRYAPGRPLYSRLGRVRAEIEAARRELAYPPPAPHSES